jgi:pimeloyl-ACP methyl ester carboxylesterase
VGVIWVWLLRGVISVVILSCAALLGGYFYENNAAAREAKRFPPPGQLVDVGGRSIHLLCKGDAAGPTVVIEPGAGEPAMLWWSVQDQISAFARVCTYDRAGYQWSAPFSEQRSIEDRARELHEVLARANVPAPYVLVAHSYGGAIVRLFARDHMPDTAGVVLVDVPDEVLLFGERYASVIFKSKWILAAATIAMRTGVVRIMSMFAGGDQEDEPQLSVEAQRMWPMAFRPAALDAAADELASIERAPTALRRAGGFGALGNLHLIVVAHGQPFPGMFATLEVGFREGQERLAALSSNSELVIAEHANHNINMDAPEVVIDAVRRVVEAAREKKPLAGR